MNGTLYLSCLLLFFSFSLSAQNQLFVAVTGSPPTCGGASNGTAIAQTSGGIPPYSFLWNTGATTPAINGLPGGTYSVTVTDQLNDMASGSITHVEFPTMNLVLADTAYCDGTGDVEAIASGGLEPYFYAWSNGVNGASQVGLPAGDYCVTVYDFAGCSVEGCVAIPDTMTVIVNTTEVSCHDECDATVSAIVNGGTPPYTYAWNVGADTQEIPGMHINTYIVTVTDANGCMQTGTGVVTGPDSLGVTFTGDPIECGTGAVGTASVQPFGGTQPYFIYWSNGDFGPVATGLAGDSTYYVTVMMITPAKWWIVLCWESKVP